MHSRAVFLGQTGMWGIHQWHWFIIGLTAIAAVWTWSTTRQRWPVAIVLTVVVLDIAWHVLNPISTPYMHLINPGFLALNITAILIIWHIGQQLRRDGQHTYLSVTTLVIPIIIGWNIFVSHSPLTAIYAEIYGGGDTLIGQGSSSLFLFVATWSGVWIWIRQKSAPFGSFTGISMLLALSQIAIKGEWRFVLIVTGAAIIAELSHRHWPTRWHLNSVLWTIGFGGGYFMVLNYTTSIAWQTTIWTGILMIMILISYALARISNPYQSPIGGN
ncbi:MAG: hypothetical protein ACO3F2_12230 [Roseiflexaceae bacterium]|jgi:hypothetical protein